MPWQACHRQVSHCSPQLSEHNSKTSSALQMPRPQLQLRLTPHTSAVDVAFMQLQAALTYGHPTPNSSTCTCMYQPPCCACSPTHPPAAAATAVVLRTSAQQLVLARSCWVLMQSTRWTKLTRRSGEAVAMEAGEEVSCQSVLLVVLVLESSHGSCYSCDMCSVAAV
jgi:hypothetical protein